MVENSKRAKSSWAAIVSAIVAVISVIVSGYFSFHSYQNNQRAAKAEQAAQLTYENIQKERNTILNDAFAQAMHFGAVISGQGSKNGKTNIIIKYNNQSGLPMRDVYFILLPNNRSLEDRKIAAQGMYFPMHVVDTNSGDLILEENKVGEDDIKNNYYVALIFKDSQGKYWVNDSSGLRQINQSEEENLLSKLKSSYKLNPASN